MDVVIVGGGIAGLEAAAALRALAGRRVHTTLVEPRDAFVYRALSVAEAFGAARATRYPIEPIAQGLSFDLVHDSVDRVDTAGRRLFLGRGELRYDALVVALGARQRRAWDHTLTFSGPRDVATMRALVGEVRRGVTGSVAFVVPGGMTWPLPLYELALMTAASAAEAGVEVDLAVFTPEPRPLAALGRDASDELARKLDGAGVRYACGDRVEVSYDGDVVIAAQEMSLSFDRVVAVPSIVGPAPLGLPHDVYGFLPVDAGGAVRGIERVYAAGDCTDNPIKQGRLAAQQADVIAASIARLAGAAVGRQQAAEPQATKEVGAHLAPYLASLGAAA